jgi:hypothetical protein
MSFYNVANPTNFAVLDLMNRQGTIAQPKLLRASASNVFSGAATLTTEEVLAAIIVVNTAAGAITLTLPSAADLLAGLNAGSFASSPVAVNDIIYVQVNVYGSAGNAATLQTAGGVSSTTVAARTTEMVGIQFTNVTAGSEAMTILN